MKLKKLSLIMLVLLMCAGIFTGCKGKEQKAFSLDEKDTEKSLAEAIQKASEGRTDKDFAKGKCEIINVLYFDILTEDISKDKYKELEYSKKVSLGDLQKNYERVLVVKYSVKIDDDKIEPEEDYYIDVLATPKGDDEWDIAFFDEGQALIDATYADKTSMSRLYVQSIIAVLCLVSALIVLVYFVAKRHGVTGFGICGGIGTFLLIYYLSNIVGNLCAYMVKGDRVLRLLVGSIVVGAIYTAGKALTLKMFKLKMVKFKEALSFGLGNGITQFILGFMSLIGGMLTLGTLKVTGWDPIKFSSQAALRSAFTVAEYANNQFITEMLMYILSMVFHVAIILPILATFTKKIKGYMYLVTGVAHVIVMFIYYLFANQFMHSAVCIILMIIVDFVVVIYALRMYHFHFKKDEEERKAKELEAKKAPVKRMPKYTNNLKDL